MDGAEQLVSGDDGESSLPQGTGNFVLGLLRLLWPAIAYPTYWLWRLVVIIVQPVKYMLQLLAIPFILLKRAIFALVLMPFRLIMKFEAILTFIFVAILIGGAAGLILYFTSSLTDQLLGLQPPAKPSKTSHSPLEKDGLPRSVAEYRKSRQRKKKQQDKQVQSPREERMFRDMMASASGTDVRQSNSAWDSAGFSGRLPLSTQTILEEDDSSSSAS
ncbi:hypothetical protein BT63DRAFT_416604 [Microthyrium microscopicum]|uniref:Uncharacterized protein n=1 Tax=Microthyrium microscopicum TaxID=703497 RepID=A0A6A6U255_9PEZI|nr:hypothetical protein BT63DRAFT_416604 [Microthyrium microscopicum]